MKRAMSPIVWLVALSACNAHRDPRTCTGSAECDLGSGGECLPSASSGPSYCAYTDPGCASGWRWSTLAGDGFTGQCAAGHSQDDAGLDAAVLEPADEFANRFGSTADDVGFSVAVNQQNSLALVGTYQGTINVGGPNFMFGGGYSDTFVARFGADGDHLWSIRLDSDGTAAATDAVINEKGDVFVLGYSLGGLRLAGRDFVANGVDTFIAKFASKDGSAQWAIMLGGAGDIDQGHDLDLDQDGDLVVVGQIYPPTDPIFDPTTLGNGPVTGLGGPDAFLAKYSAATGAHIWSKVLGGAGPDRLIAVDASREGIYFVGEFEGTASFGRQSLQSAGGSRDVVVGKYRLDGTPSWTRRLGGAHPDTAAAVTVDGLGDVFVAGSFEGSADMGGLQLDSAGARDIFVAKYSGPHSELLWAKRFGGIGTDEAVDLAVDSSGNPVLLCTFVGRVPFGDATEESNGGSRDGCLVKLAGADGRVLSVSSFGGSADDTPRGLAIDSQDRALLTGAFKNAMTMAGRLLEALRADDIFFARVKH